MTTNFFILSSSLKSAIKLFSYTSTLKGFLNELGVVKVDIRFKADKEWIVGIGFKIQFSFFSFSDQIFFKMFNASYRI